MNPRSLRLKSALSLFLLIQFAGIATAQVSFKNNTTKPVNISIMKLMNNDWLAFGWETIPAGETEVLIGAPNNRYYYYFAFSEDKTWSGKDTEGWIANGRFMTTTKENYKGKAGYRKVGFKLIDVGEKGVYTVTLDLRSDFMTNLETYLKKSTLDPMEGLYTVSDEVEVDYKSSRSQDEIKKFDHWAKVSIIKDTVNLTRNYVQHILEATGFEEGDVVAEYLQTKQSPNLFISEQIVDKGQPVKKAMVEFIPDEDKLISTFTYETKDAVLKYKRTYLKYYPRK